MNWFYQVLMLPITIILLLIKAREEELASLTSIPGCTCFPEGTFLVTGDCKMHDPETEDDPEYTAQLQLREELAFLRTTVQQCSLCHGRNKVPKMCWQEEWDENTPYGTCPECWEGRRFHWLRIPLPELDPKRLYNIIQAMDRGTWKSSGQRVRIGSRLRLALYDEYKLRDLDDDDIAVIEKANQEYEQKFWSVK